MPYFVKQQVIGDRIKIEHLPLEPYQINIGCREDKRDGENLRIGIMRDQELAQAATIAADERAEPEEREGVTVEEIRELQAEDRGLGTFHSYYQQFRKR